MNFKNTMLLKTDSGSMKKVPCTLFDYETNIGTIKCGAHVSEQPWLDGVCDVSEVSTGCRMCSLPCKPKEATLNMAKASVEEFIKKHGVRAVFARIKSLKMENEN